VDIRSGHDAGRQGLSAGRDVLRLATRAMGTRFELVLGCEDGPQARAAGEAALERIEQCDARYSVFTNSSLIARANRDACEKPVRLDPELYGLLERCLALRAETDGAFDIAIGPLMRALGFRGQRIDAPRGSNLGAFELDRATSSVRFTRPDTQLDLGSIAKGHALDLAAATLRENGIESALLHGGTSSVVALGAPPDADSWRVRIGPDGTWEARLRDSALSVSAPHGRTADFAGHKVGHILDPRSGRPVPLGLRAAVIAPSAEAADAWSTAALVLRARGGSLELRRPHDQGWLLEDEGREPLLLGQHGCFAPHAGLEPTYR
jgi:thiamine biosynthesis lipoprotein